MGYRHSTAVGNSTFRAETTQCPLNPVAKRLGLGVLRLICNVRVLQWTAEPHGIYLPINMPCANAADPCLMTPQSTSEIAVASIFDMCDSEQTGLIRALICARTNEYIEVPR